MKNIKIIGGALPNIPWQDKPENCDSPIWRHTENPIIGWNPTPKTARIFNSAVLPYGDGFVGVFRADHKRITPQLHLGFSKDGLHWDIEDEEIHWLDTDGKPHESDYCYDPRLVKIEDIYYITWCTCMGGPTIGLGMTMDFKTFTRLENSFLPCNRNGVLFPRKINGMYYMLSRPSDNGHTPFGDIYLSQSADLTFWGRHRKVMSTGGGWWQSMKIGAGSAPIETDRGWLLFYHGVVNTCNGYVYSCGAALLDIENPSKVLYRSDDYLITPEEPYETTGFVPNVCFPCAALTDAATGRIALYYGAADTYVAVAYTQIDELFGWLLNHSQLIDGDSDEGR